MEHEKKRQRIITILKLCISAVMAIHLVLLCLFVPYDRGMFAPLIFGLGYIIYIMFNTISVFKKISRTFISFIFLLIALYVNLTLTSIISGNSHFNDTIIPTTMDNWQFIIVSHIVVAGITIVLSSICIVLSKKKTNKKTIAK